MSSAASGSGIAPLMDAYAVLEVEHSATPDVIRRAYKRLAREHHPDRHAPGSPGHPRATARMAEINAAYQLIRDAPLRFHRVSTGARPDEPWTDAELDAAIRRAKNDRMFGTLSMYAFVAVTVLLLPLTFAVLIPGQNTSTSMMAVYLLMIPFWLVAGSFAARRRGVLLLWRVLDIYNLLR